MSIEEDKDEKDDVIKVVVFTIVFIAGIIGSAITKDLLWFLIGFGLIAFIYLGNIEYWLKKIYKEK